MSVSLNEIANRIMMVIAPKLGDDYSIDISEIKYDVENARAMLIKQRYGTKFRNVLPEGITVPIRKLEIESINASTSPILSQNVIMRTKLKLPKILENHTGLPMIKRISSATLLSNNFTMVTPQQAVYVGNGKFNQGNIFCFYEDDYLYLVTKRDLYRGIKYIDLDFVPSRPTEAFEFLNTNYSSSAGNLYDSRLPTTDDGPYPVTLDMINDIEQLILKSKLVVEAGQRIDDINDSSDTPKQIVQQ